MLVIKRLMIQKKSDMENLSCQKTNKERMSILRLSSAFFFQSDEIYLLPIKIQVLKDACNADRILLLHSSVQATRYKDSGKIFQNIVHYIPEKTRPTTANQQYQHFKTKTTVCTIVFARQAIQKPCIVGTNMKLYNFLVQRRCRDHYPRVGKAKLPQQNLKDEH